jgi:predicted translin family RNA/ssDNA-binding protein
MKKKPKKSKEFDESREFGAVLEKIYSDIKIISEGQSVLRDKLDATMGMVAKNVENITMLNIRTSGIKDDLTKMNGKLTHIEEDLRIIKSEFNKRLTLLEASSHK